MSSQPEINPNPGPELMAGRLRGRLAFFLCLLTMSGLFAFSVATYPDLPERIPLHFNSDGQADRWADKDWATWLLLPFVGLMIWLLMLGSARLVNWARKHPRLLSMPYKKRFLALPSERQEPVWQIMRNMMHWIAWPTLLMMAYAQFATWQVARGAWTRLDDRPIISLLGLIGLVCVLCLIGLVRAVRRAVDNK